MDDRAHQTDVKHDIDPWRVVIALAPPSRSPHSSGA